MPDLRVGHDYHLAEVHRSASADEDGHFGWLAACKGCGWIGPTRATKAAAEDDAAAHDTTENE